MIQTFIFDLDGTLYPKNSDLYLIMSSLITKWFKTYLKVSNDDFIEFYENMKQNYPNPLEAIQVFGLSTASYYQEVFKGINPKHYLLEDVDVKYTLSRLLGKKFLVTLSSRGHAEKVLQALSVNQYFSEIYNPGVNWHTYHKIDVYEKIRKECKLSANEICVIGDDYAVDIETAKNAGYSCVLVSKNKHMTVPTISTIRQLLSLNNISNTLERKEDSSVSEKIINTIQNAFARTTDEIFSLEEWKKLLGGGKRLRIKYGVDVTAPYLHIGHAVNLWMMRLLQDYGHKIIFLIGDFTTQIGDPTGKSKTRPVISQEEIEQNTEEFIKQAKMVLRFDDPDLLEIRKNSEWFGDMPMREFLKILSMVTYSRLISRDMFQKRFADQADIYMHELIYPILQGYDSFVLKSDLTIIGSDQLFNEMMGRFYQERFGQTPQVIITTKITPGIDGGAKQSKSLDNYIGLGHSPRDKFGRTMRLPDNLIYTYFEVYTSVSESDLKGLADLVQSNPLEAKKQLAAEIIKRYHGDVVAKKEREWFDQTFSQHKTPPDIPGVVMENVTVMALNVVKKFFGDKKSNSEVRRLFQQGSISRNNVKVINAMEQLTLSDGDVFQIGKRTWFKIRFQKD